MNAVLTINFHRLIIFESGESVTILIAAKAEKNKTKECGISPKKENGKNKEENSFHGTGSRYRGALRRPYDACIVHGTFERRNTGEIFGGAYGACVVHTGGDTGTFRRMHTFKHIVRRNTSGCYFRKHGYAYRRGAHISAPKKSPWLAPVPPIVANTLIIPPVLKYFYALDDAVWYLYVTVGIGEIISCGVLGMILFGAIKKKAPKIFGM